MKALLYGLACTLAATATVAARDTPRGAEQRRVLLAPLERAATDCFAETIGNNPAALAHARAGRWYEAAGVIGFLCRPEVDAMARAHDRLDGRGAGGRYFTGAYVRHLGQELAQRLEPQLTTKTWANAEPRSDAEVAPIPASAP
ncbi:hypothetical protein OPKNFCMD_0853 [Methylobacterium crusticola]|uniref:DUF5330 domain-containing protein n=2 Tax=Methylobacterium crusticola TaxID=1697972 RepID=A0ABQ4QSH1_9HYPH|nr:hypothetical protein OPKNFCMD_0853 [Methylobacterium crusticola]